MNSDFKILLADDSSENYVLIKAYLKNTKFTLDYEENGLLALNKLKSFDYDIVLMDVEMPVMDGIMAAIEIRKFEKLNNKKKPTKLIALTAHTTNNSASEFDAYLVKPISKKNLIETLTKLVIEL